MQHRKHGRKDEDKAHISFKKGEVITVKFFEIRRQYFIMAASWSLSLLFQKRENALINFSDFLGYFQQDFDDLLRFIYLLYD